MDPCAAVADAKLNLAQSLAGCAAQQPGRLGGIIVAGRCRLTVPHPVLKALMMSAISA